MLNDNAKKWVEALRSGKYSQGRSNLRKGDKYCCLGVACDLALQEYLVEEELDSNTGEFCYDGLMGTLPESVMDWLGLATDGGEYGEEGSEEEDSLVYLNDTRGYTFSEIADFIESEPEGLFRK